MAGIKFELLLIVIYILFSVVPAHTAEPPSRVVSINLCSDQLLLMLARPEQIASVSRLSREPNSSFMAASAARYPVNDGKIEQLLAQDPDLILANAVVIVLGIITSLLPAWRAAQYRPVEALSST